MAGSLDRYSPLAAIQPHHRPAIRKIDQFVSDIGGGNVARGRERVLACLYLSAHTDERLDLLATYAEDPDLSGRSFGDLAIAAGFRAGELIKILKETGMLVAQAHSQQIISDHLPAVVQDIVTRAQNHWIACAACDATGKVTPDPKEKPNPGPEDCDDCRGKGQILVAADPDRQDRVLEMARMLPESKGTSIGVGVNVGARDGAPAGSLAAGSMGTLFSQLVGATDRLLHPDRSAAGARSQFSVQPPASTVAPVDGVVVSSPSDVPPSEDPP